MEKKSAQQVQTGYEKDEELKAKCSQQLSLKDEEAASREADFKKYQAQAEQKLEE